MNRLVAGGLSGRAGKQAYGSTNVIASGSLRLNRRELGGERRAGRLRRCGRAHGLGWSSGSAWPIARGYGTPMTSWRPPPAARAMSWPRPTRDGYALLGRSTTDGAAMAA